MTDQAPAQRRDGDSTLEECVLRLGRVMSNVTDFRELLLSVMSECKALLHCEAASVALYEADEKHLIFIASAGGASDELSQFHIALGQGIVGKVAETRESIVANDCRNDPRWFSKVDDGTGFVTRNLAAMPMLHGEELIGVLEALNRHGDAPFAEEDIRLLRIFADQAGVAIRLQRLIREKQEGERLAAIGVAVADSAHSVKNILMRLKPGVGLIDRALEKRDWELLEGAWPIMKRGTHQINDLVLEMLDFSKPAEPEFETAALRDLLGGIADHCREDAMARGIALTMRIEPEDGVWNVDASMLHPALMNLVGNAIEALSDHETVDGAIALSAEMQDGKLILRVADNGPGIPEEIREKIFKPFFTTRKKAGTGLGLANVVKAAEAHSGKLTLETEEHKGSTFILTLPRN